MMLRSMALAVAVAVGTLTGGAAQAQTKDFKIGLVASLTGNFAGPSTDSVEGIKAWIKARGLPGRMSCSRRWMTRATRSARRMRSAASPPTPTSR